MSREQFLNLIKEQYVQALLSKLEDQLMNYIPASIPGYRKPLKGETILTNWKQPYVPNRGHSPDSNGLMPPTSQVGFMVGADDNAWLVPWPEDPRLKAFDPDRHVGGLTALPPGWRAVGADEQLDSECLYINIHGKPVRWASYHRKTPNGIEVAAVRSKFWNEHTGWIRPATKSCNKFQMPKFESGKDNNYCAICNYPSHRHLVNLQDEVKELEKKVEVKKALLAKPSFFTEKGQQKLTYAANIKPEEASLLSNVNEYKHPRSKPPLTVYAGGYDWDDIPDAPNTLVGPVKPEAPTPWHYGLDEDT